MRHRIRLVFAIVVLCGLSLVGCVSMQDRPATSNDAPVSIPFTLNAQHNIVVEAQIDESAPLKLMLHTASSEVTLTEDAVRRLTGIAFDEKTKIQSWGGTSDSRASAGHRVRIGGLVRDDITLWENKHSGDGTGGKFGLDYFGGSVVEIDYDAGRIRVYSALPDKAKRYEAIPIENDNGTLFVRGVCAFADRKHENRFMIHSGYGGGLLLDDDFAASSGIDTKIVITETSRLTDSFGHTIEVKKGLMPAFALNNITLHDVPVGFFPGAIGRQKTSVLGADILKRFNLIFDVVNARLYVQAREKASS
jgi:hypothetical protein